MTEIPTDSPAINGPAVSGERRAWAWVEHLRHGGTTPWASFAEEGEARGPLLPGAIQLEVLRRLNQVSGGAADPLAASALADRVLESSAPGRGQPDLQLAGAREWSGFGPPLIDPANIKPGELVRLAVGALAELTVDSDPGPVEQPKPPRRMPWRRSGLFQRGFHIVGNPLAADQTREALARAGRHPGRRSPVAVVLADDLGGMFADLWGWRVRRMLGTTFPSWVGQWAKRDELPMPLDTAAVANRWARKVGADNVHVVVQRHPAAEVARIVGARQPLDGAHTGLSGAASQLVRDVNGVLRVLVDAERHQHLLDSVLLPWLADEHGPRWAVPKRHEEWVRRRADRLREELSAGRYSLHGDLDLLVPQPGNAQPGNAQRPSDDAVLQIALRTLLQAKEEVR
jgi:hypothetical protein